MIIKTQQGVYTHSEWWQQAKVEGNKTSLMNLTAPVGSVLLLNKRKEGIPKALFEALATALEQSQKYFDVEVWCKSFEDSAQGSKKKRASKEG